MRFVCEKSEFLEGLSTVQKAINSQNTLPVLGNILLKAEQGRVFLSATNLEIAISTVLKAEVKNEGSLTVPAKTLVNYVSFLKEGEIEVSLENGDSIAIKSADSATKIKGIPSDEFPELPAIQQEFSFVIDSKTLKTAFDQTVFSCSPSSTRPVLSGILFWGKGKNIKFVGTDSYRLGEKTVEIESELEEFKRIVPARTIQELSRILSKDDASAEVLVSQNQIFFKIGHTEVSSRLIDGAFPDYQRIIPDSFQGTAVVNKSDFVLGIKRAGIFARENENNNVKVSIEADTISITTDETQIGADNTHIAATVNGDAETVALNAQFLLEVLQNISSEEIKISYGQKLSPVAIQSSEDESFIHIIMPLKV